VLRSEDIFETGPSKNSSVLRSSYILHGEDEPSRSEQLRCACGVEGMFWHNSVRQHATETTSILAFAEHDYECQCHADDVVAIRFECGHKFSVVEPGKSLNGSVYTATKVQSSTKD
jgi:hypothetical protein